MQHRDQRLQVRGRRDTAGLIGRGRRCPDALYQHLLQLLRRLHLRPATHQGGCRRRTSHPTSHRAPHPDSTRPGPDPGPGSTARAGGTGFRFTTTVDPLAAYSLKGVYLP